MRWLCSLCLQEKSGIEFVRGVDPDLGRSYLARVLSPGPFRRCLACMGECRPALHKSTRRYDMCKSDLPQDNFSQAAWRNSGSKERRCLCRHCATPECNAVGCQVCKSCRSPMCRIPKCTNMPIDVHSSMRPSTEKERDEWICPTCKTSRLVCPLCLTTDEDAFPTTARHNRKRGPHYCTDCAVPRCKNGLACLTCKACRHPRCQDPLCTEEPISVNRQRRPQCIEARNNFVCERCAQAMNALYACAGCRTKSAATAFDANDVRLLKKDKRRKMLCKACEDKGITALDSSL